MGKRVLSFGAGRSTVSISYFAATEHFSSTAYALHRRAKRGMWAHGTDGETPTEYKKRYAGTTPVTRT
jgi:hypothetical protein